MLDILQNAVGEGAFEEAPSADGMPTIYVPRERLVEVATALRDSEELRFSFLSDVTAADYYPREPRFELIYLLASLGVPGFGTVARRLRMKVRVPGADATAPSVSSVWPAANWAEREVYDMFGIHFSDHPDLRRVLMPEDWEGFPARKDYPVQIKQPVKTYAPLQVSQEQFVANIEANRDRARRD